MSEFSAADSAALKRFRDDGLVWLVNTAILHTRGFALAVIFDDSDTEFQNPTGLKIVGDGSEPWVFGPDQTESAITGYSAAEAKRESEWSSKLNPK